MDLVNSFLKLINDIEPLTIILMIAGLILIISAFTKSSYFTFGFTGVLSLGAAVAIRVINGGDIAQVFIMVFVILFIITVSLMMSMRFSKYGWIIRMPVSREDIKKAKK